MRGRRLDWEGVALAALRHGVAPIVAENLRACDPPALGVPADVADRLERSLWENVAARQLQARRLAAILGRFAARGIEALLVKGPALEAAGVYERPWATASRDLDLVLRPRPGAPPGDEARDLRRALYPRGVECDWLAHHDVTMNGVLPVDFDRIWADARPISWRGEAALLAAPEDLLIALAVNACRKRYARLKALFDLAEAVARLRELDWDLLGEKARGYGCQAIVMTALLVTGATLGCAVPEGALEELQVGKKHARALRALVAGFVRHGSFAARRGRGIAVILTYGSFGWREARRSAVVSLRRPRRGHRRTPGPLPGVLPLQ